MTPAENMLIEAALNWRRLHGPATPMTSSAMTSVANFAEEVIRERNLAHQAADQTPTVSRQRG